MIVACAVEGVLCGSGEGIPLVEQPLHMPMIAMVRRLRDLGSLVLYSSREEEQVRRFTSSREIAFDYLVGPWVDPAWRGETGERPHEATQRRLVHLHQTTRLDIIIESDRALAQGLVEATGATALQVHRHDDPWAAALRGHENAPPTRWGDLA